MSATGGRATGSSCESERRNIETRRDAAERSLYAAVHSAFDIAYLGLWSPGEGRHALLMEFVEQLTALADALQIEADCRDVWVSAAGVVSDVGIDEPKPAAANRWAGLEVWLSGPAAALLIDDLAGLYAFPIVGKDTARCLILPATPEMPHVPACCSSPVLGTPLRPNLKGIGPLYRRFHAPRPSDLLRRSTYEGKPAPWPVAARSNAAYVQRIRAHLSHTETLSAGEP